MARKNKFDRDEVKENQRDRKRDRDGWKASRQAARRNKNRRRAFENGEKF
ncbi:hypothetical protein MAL1_00245 [Bacteriophage DSS3_MAL1]|nr:hypothetical protein MAL1_00245 [Bacteriophage DSS3_MAL1]